jgi:hypothetical protein
MDKYRKYLETNIQHLKGKVKTAERIDRKNVRTSVISSLRPSSERVSLTRASQVRAQSKGP